jgi:hypothetical protein
MYLASSENNQNTATRPLVNHSIYEKIHQTFVFFDKISLTHSFLPFCARRLTSKGVPNAYRSHETSDSAMTEREWHRPNTQPKDVQ